MLAFLADYLRKSSRPNIISKLKQPTGFAHFFLFCNNILDRGRWDLEGGGIANVPCNHNITTICAFSYTQLQCGPKLCDNSERKGNDPILIARTNCKFRSLQN